MLLKKTCFYLVLVLLPFLIMEGIFRLLPVSNPPHILPVSERTPVARFQPNVEYFFSSGWNFAIRASKRSNNFGYVNVSDYHPDDTTPLLAVIGDSFVEAHAIETGKSAWEILDSSLRGAGRVYSIGLSGAPLSQYLVFARFARNAFRPRAMAFIIIGNDFDESLLKYKADPRFHYFAENGEDLELRRVDYELSGARTVLRKSAFVRYVMLNLVAGHVLEDVRRSLAVLTDARADAHRNETTPKERLDDSRRAVDKFFAELPAASGLASDSILFVVDAMRPAIYSTEALLRARAGYVSQMRRYFMEQAAARGYEVIDLQTPFMERHRLDGSRFEFPTDGHWNALGHEIVAREIRNSTVFSRVFHNRANPVPR